MVQERPLGPVSRRRSISGRMGELTQRFTFAKAVRGRRSDPDGLPERLLPLANGRDCVPACVRFVSWMNKPVGFAQILPGYQSQPLGSEARLTLCFRRRGIFMVYWLRFVCSHALKSINTGRGLAGSISRDSGSALVSSFRPVIFRARPVGGAFWPPPPAG